MRISLIISLNFFFLINQTILPQLDNKPLPATKGTGTIVFTIYDPMGLSIVGAKVDYQIYVLDKFLFSNSQTTNQEGKVTEIVDKFPIMKVKYEISKDGYCNVKDEWKIYDSEGTNKKEIFLYPVDNELGFQLIVQDYDNNLVKAADVQLVLKYEDGYTDNFTFKTDDLGMVNAVLTLVSDHLKNPCTEYINLSVGIKKPDFHLLKEENLKYKSGSKVKLNLELTSPNDYFTKEFLNNNKNINLREKISEFIDYLALKSILSNCILVNRSVGLSDFKSKKNLTFKFESMNVYNSIRYNKYDIGKILFDEVIRKILEPLNIYLFNVMGFSSFDLTVIGKTKDFLNEDKEKDIIYRFIIPKEIVTQYKNKDISGQTVLDKSIILMDDERIELKLQ